MNIASKEYSGFDAEVHRAKKERLGCGLDKLREATFPTIICICLLSYELLEFLNAPKLSDIL